MKKIIFIITFLFICVSMTNAQIIEPNESLYPGLPKILLTRAGQRVTDVASWENVRRKEIMQIFTDSVYGRCPAPGTYTSTFSVVSTIPIWGGKAVKKVVKFTITGPNGPHSFDVGVYIPNSTSKVPAFVFCNNRAAFTGTSSSSEFFPLDNAILPRGYAVAVLNYEDISVDAGTNYIWRNGLWSKFNLTGIYDWKSISAWSFAMSRIIDYLVTDPLIDSNKILTIGHSRGGKTALWTAAQDQRVAMACVNNSGCTGDRLLRGTWQWGETIQQINTSFDYWFSTKYRSYNGMEKTLPFDFHMLIAAVAPRKVAQGLASADDGADPERQWQGMVFSQPAFALYGKTQKTWQTTDWTGKASAAVSRNGNLQSHVRIGGHGMYIEDWNHYMDFFELKDPVVDNSTNVAHLKPVTTSGVTDPGANLVDEDIVSRWSADVFPQSAEIDLGAIYDLNKLELYPYQNRDYKYTISAKTDSGSAFTTVIDKSNNTSSAAVFTHPVNISARYLKITVTGATTYTGTWTALNEFKAFGTLNGTMTVPMISEQKYSVYPNPVQDYINVSIPNITSSSIEFKLYDLLGQLVLTDRFNSKDGKWQLDVKGLNRGVHILEIKFDNQVLFEKIIKK